MEHHVIYWRLARFEAQLDDAALGALWRREQLGEVYIEFVDGSRRRLAWDGRRHRWTGPPLETQRIAA
jgi:hypothetical protein